MSFVRLYLPELNLFQPIDGLMHNVFVLICLSLEKNIHYTLEANFHQVCSSDFIIVLCTVEISDIFLYLLDDQSFFSFINQAFFQQN